MILTSKQKSLYAFSALFSLALLLIGREHITELISGPNQEKVQTGTLVKEFLSIPIRGGDRWKGSPDTFDKGVITGATADILSKESPKEVISYYLSSLPPLGWKLSGKKNISDGQKLKFCKNGVSLIVDASADQSETKYYLGLVWTKFHQSPTYCAR